MSSPWSAGHDAETRGFRGAGHCCPSFPLSPLQSPPPLCCQLRLQQQELMNGMHACNNFVASVFLPSCLPTLLSESLLGTGEQQGFKRVAGAREEAGAVSTLSTSCTQPPAGRACALGAHQIPLPRPPRPPQAQRPVSPKTRDRGWRAEGSPCLAGPDPGLCGLSPAPPPPRSRDKDPNMLIKGPESRDLKHSLPDLKPGNSKAFLSFGRQASR